MILIDIYIFQFCPSGLAREIDIYAKSGTTDSALGCGRCRAMPFPVHRPSVAGSHFAWEDEDFIQLRIEREKNKRHKKLTQKPSSDTLVSNPSGSFRPPKTNGADCSAPEGPSGSKEVKQSTKGYVAVKALSRIKIAADHQNKDECLQRKLFKAIEEGNLEKFNKRRTKYGNGVDLDLVRDPDTDMNVLHYSLEKKCIPIAASLVREGSTQLISSKFMLQTLGITSFKNVLHILAERGDRDMIDKVLNQIADKEVKFDMFRQEILVHTDGLRPNPLPCLHLAAYHGHTDLVEHFLETFNISSDMLNSKYESALMWSARGGQLDCVKLLIAKGADPNLVNDKGTTAFYWSVRYNHLQVARTLINEGKADPHKKRKFGLVTPLIVASAYGYAEMVELVLSQPGCDINFCIRGGETALHYATREGHTDIVHMLLDRGAIPDQPDEIGDTPLLIATKYGHVELANIFIYRGARLDQRNHEGYDIWQYAIHYEGVDLLKALIVATQDVPYPGRQPLNIAASMGNIDKIEFLISIGLDTQSIDKDGNSFLHFAAMYDQSEVIKRFCNRDLLDFQNKKGNTVFHIACYRGHEHTIRTLVELKANPGMINNKGETVLHCAAYSNEVSTDAVQTLMEYTIKDHSWDVVNLKDHQGNNCLHIAAKHATPDVIWEFRSASITDQDKDGFTPLHNAVRADAAEIVDTMLDIFELAGRDVRINEQTFVTRETALHIAADKCHLDSVKRLLQLGADVSEQDCNGNTVLHRLVILCVQDSHRKLQYLELFDAILENMVTWWCITNHISIPYENDGETIMSYREQAIIHISSSVLNNEGMSVCDLGFAIGCPDVLSRLLMMPGVTYFITETDGEQCHVFDISGLMPRTLRTTDLKYKSGKKQRKEHKAKENILEEEMTLLNEQVTCDNSAKIQRNKHKTEGNTPEEEMKLLQKQIKDVKEKKLSGLDWLLTCRDVMKTSEILDLPPVGIIERHFSSIVAWTFTILLVLHVIYMALFTYVGIDVQNKVRNATTNLSSLTYTDPNFLYFIVPLEPFIIVVFFIYLLFKYCFTGDVKRRLQLSKNQSVWTFLTVMTEYVLPLIYFSFAMLVFLWIFLLHTGYKHQDNVLAVTICIGWLLAICFTRGIKKVHFFYKMLIGIIIRDVFRFLLVYMFVLLAISLALHVLFQASADVTNVYKTPGSTIFLTFNLMMGMGELFDDTLHEGMHSVDKTTNLIRMFYLLYIVLGSLVMLNVLIAMMNDSYSKVLKEGSANWRIDSIKLGMEIERGLAVSRIFSSVSTTNGPLGSLSTRRWSVTISESEVQEYFHMLERKALRPDALTKRMDSIDQRTVAIEKLLTHNLQQITENMQAKKKKKHLFNKKFGLFGKTQDGGKTSIGD